MILLYRIILHKDSQGTDVPRYLINPAQHKTLLPKQLSEYTQCDSGTLQCLHLDPAGLSFRLTASRLTWSIITVHHYLPLIHTVHLNTCHHLPGCLTDVQNLQNGKPPPKRPPWRQHSGSYPIEKLGNRSGH